MSLPSETATETHRRLQNRLLLRRAALRMAALRALLRARESETALIGLAALVGYAVGFFVGVVSHAVSLLHYILFGVPLFGHLSNQVETLSPLYFFMPAVGGVAVGLTSAAIRYFRPREIVDAIEANALYGGRMSMRDSISLAVLTVLSVGFGGSAGLEAAYTQIGSGFASKAGQYVRLRRQDLRLMVGCGAAAAISAAFDSPLSGAFYAFELVIGSYTLQALAPVGAAALAGNLAIVSFFGAEPLFVLPSAASLQSHDYGAFVLLGLGAAAVSVIAMRAVTEVERGFRSYRVAGWIRPMIGGTGVGLVAFFYSEVIGSGHGAISNHINGPLEPLALAGLLIAKILASAFTVGSGMRGGLFSSSLFLGTVFGSTVAAAVASAAPGLAINAPAYALVGMAAIAAGIVGAPVTMILLVLETTGNFSLTMGVMVGVIACTVAVRQSFGYSFATWRFHTRGIRIRGAHDVGWIAELTVGKLMRRDFHLVYASDTVARLRERFPLGASKYAFVVDASDRYIGTIETVEAHSPAYDATANETLAELLIHAPPDTLEPQENVREALIAFSKTASEVLAVVDSRKSGRVVGSLSEAYTLRRYTQELEKQRLDAADGGVFSPDVA